jgi:hypothetical protein
MAMYSNSLTPGLLWKPASIGFVKGHDNSKGWLWVLAGQQIQSPARRSLVEDGDFVFAGVDLSIVFEWEVKIMCE